MLSSVVLAAAFLSFFWPFWSFVLSATVLTKHQDDDENLQSDDLAEIDGGVWKQLSIFEHIELGLKKTPDGPAVICLFPPLPDLQELVGRSQIDEAHVGDVLNTLPYDKSITIHEVNGVNGTNSTNGLDCHHIDKKPGLWNKPHNGWIELTAPSTHKPIPSPSPPSHPYFTLTYQQLHRSALRLAASLLANGAQPGTVMLMLIPNGGEYAILLWTCILLRITYVSVDPSSLDISGYTMLKHTLSSLKPQLIVAPDAASGRAIDVAVAELELPQPVRMCLSQPSSPTHWRTLATIAHDVDKYPVNEAALVLATKHDHPSRIHYLLFTSGTSGVPKGCPLTVGGMSHVLHSQAWLVDSESGTSQFALQQAHSSRAICPLQTLQTWRAGGCVLMTERGLRVDDVAEAICGAHPYRATFIVLSPPMVHELATELISREIREAGLKPDISSVKRIQLGGDAVTKDILAKCAALFPQAQICVNHGMSEGPGMFVWPFLERRVSDIPYFGEICPIGVVAPGSLIRVWDADAKRTVKRGQLGELHVSRGSVIRSYWAGRSSESFICGKKGTWFNTGDVAILSKDGLVFILGRKKDMIKRAEVGIMPAAIESSIEAFTGAQVSDPQTPASPEVANISRRLWSQFRIMFLAPNHLQCSAPIMGRPRKRSRVTSRLRLAGNVL